MRSWILEREAFFCGEEEAGAVGVNAAAFEDYAVVAYLRLELGHVVEPGDVIRDLVVAVVVFVLGPGVELPVCDG